MIEFRAQLQDYSNYLQLYAKETKDGESFAVTCKGLAFTLVSPERRNLIWPTFLELPLDTDAGQSLFNALWQVGFRPHKGESGIAHVEALKFHLEDMRKLVFKNK